MASTHRWIRLLAISVHHYSQNFSYSFSAPIIDWLSRWDVTAAELVSGQGDTQAES